MSIGFIGAGKMGGALAKAVANSSEKPKILIFDRSPEAVAALVQSIGAEGTSRKALLEQCEFVFLGLKPQVLPQAAKEIGGELEKAPVLITMAAGVSIASLQEWLGKECPIIRIMPNIPVAAGQGTVLYTCAPSVTEEQKCRFLQLMEKAGLLLELPEKLIDAGCAISGCGPAFVCLFAEALADGGVACGLSRDQAQRMAAQTILGTAALLLRENGNPGELKDSVCSPGGSTIRGVLALEQGAFRGTVMNAVQKAYEKTVELGKVQ